MPDGGTLAIKTENLTLPREGQETDGVGDHVVLTVSDDGEGMDEETMSHIFEPFFSTKADQGSGLGLATVYGITKQAGGFVRVTSRPGAGTTFQVFFPRSASQPVEADDAGAQDVADGKATILLVEDEEMVRSMVKRMLERLEYTVLAARDGPSAIELYDRSAPAIDLLLTDVIMPRMNGRELLDQLRTKLPRLQVLFLSGYTDDAIARHGVLEQGVSLIQKPFGIATLRSKVQQALGR
jgi:CheY-like chemotaxis protein